MPSSEEIKQIIKLRLNLQDVGSDATEALLSYHLSAACFEVASDSFYPCLMKTLYQETDENGAITVTKRVLPYQFYYGGLTNENRTWFRLTPVEYNYFERHISGFTAAQTITTGNSFARRYSIVPDESDPDTTVIQILEIATQQVNTKLIYYPLTPDPSDFPGEFTPLLVNMVLLSYGLDRGSDTKDQYFQMLMKRTDDLRKKIKSKFNAVEANLISTIKNKQTNHWLLSEGNDIRVWTGFRV